MPRAEARRSTTDPLRHPELTASIKGNICETSRGEGDMRRAFGLRCSSDTSEQRIGRRRRKRGVLQTAEDLGEVSVKAMVESLNKISH